MVIKSIENSIKVIGITLLGISLIACNPTAGLDELGTTANVDPSDALNGRLSWPAGTVPKTGNFPSPTNLLNNISLTSPSTSATTLSPTSGQGNLPISMTNAVPGQNTNVNVKFGSGSSFVSVPVSGSTITSSSGTLNVGFNVPSNICDNVADIQHQIKCYEQVTLADGSQVSSQTARDMILACGTSGGGSSSTGGGFATGPSDYCVNQYPQSACTQFNDGTVSGTTSRYHSSGTCATLYPNARVDTNDFSQICAAGTLGPCGVCAIQFNTSSSSTGNEINAAESSITAEEAMFNALTNAVNNPESGGLTVTFTPAE